MSTNLEDIEMDMKIYNDELKKNINDYIFTGDDGYLQNIEVTVTYNFEKLLKEAEDLKFKIEKDINNEYESNKLDVDAVMLMSHSELIEQYSKELNLSVPLRRDIYYSSLKEKIRMWMYIIGIVCLIVFIVKYMLKLKVGDVGSDKTFEKNPLKIKNPFETNKTDNVDETKVILPSKEKEVVSGLKEGEV